MKPTSCRLVQRAGSGEDEGDEQDLAELAGPAGRHQEGAEAGLEAAAVFQDRDRVPIAVVARAEPV